MKEKFPNCSEVCLDEGILFVSILAEDPNASADKIKSFINGIDDALKIQKMASVHNKIRGKQKRTSKSAREIIHERLMLINI